MFLGAADSSQIVHSSQMFVIHVLAVQFYVLITDLLMLGLTRSLRVRCFYSVIPGQCDV